MSTNVEMKREAALAAVDVLCDAATDDLIDDMVESIKAQLRRGDEDDAMYFILEGMTSTQLRMVRTFVQSFRKVA